MVIVDSRLYQRYRDLRAALLRKTEDPTLRQRCILLHIELFYVPQRPGRPLSVPHPLKG